MIGGRGPGLGTALVGGCLLAAATPPAIVPGAEFLVLAGLLLWFRVATAGSRPHLHSYLLGCLHMAWFSWSVRHVLWPAYAAIVLLGGFYFVFGTAMVRCLPRRGAVWSFAIAVAGAFWLRANMPEIYYPHGQPCHCLWQWPRLLGATTLGGEALVNALLGGLAAAGSDLWQSWRLGLPAWRGAVRAAGLVLAVAVGSSVVGECVRRGAAGTSDAKVSLAAVEPGLHPFDPYAGLTREQGARRFRELFEERLLAPTRRLLEDAPGPDLVLWPESSVAMDLPVGSIEAGQARVALARLPECRLLVGANVERADGDTPAALLLQMPGGRVLGHHEKRRLVPGGEFLPLLGWLPDRLAAALRGAFLQALGSAPDCRPGEHRPPLATADGVRFGALLCYDNAYPGPAAEHVEAGARFLCVLSNEAWYRGGGELTQLAAMTVCRALELATPIVRCTTDGWSLAVDADGGLASQLPMQPSPAAASRILRVELALGPGRLPPVAWLRAGVGPSAAALLGLALLHGFWRWARLRVARTAAIAAGGPGEPVPPNASGS